MSLKLTKIISSFLFLILGICFFLLDEEIYGMWVIALTVCIILSMLLDYIQEYIERR